MAWVTSLKWFILTCAIVTHGDEEKIQRHKRDLQFIKNILSSTFFNSDNSTNDAPLPLPPPPTLPPLVIRQSPGNYKVYGIPKGYKTIYVKRIPQVTGVTEDVTPVDIIPATSTLGLLETYLGTKTPNETLVALQGVKNLLQSGVLTANKEIIETVPINEDIVIRSPHIEYNVPFINKENDGIYSAELQVPVASPARGFSEAVNIQAPDVSYVIPSVAGPPRTSYGVPLAEPLAVIDNKPTKLIVEAPKLPENVQTTYILNPEINARLKTDPIVEVVKAPEVAVTEREQVKIGQIVPRIQIKEFNPTVITRLPTRRSGFYYKQISPGGAITTYDGSERNIIQTPVKIKKIIEEGPRTYIIDRMQKLSENMPVVRNALNSKYIYRIIKNKDFKLTPVSEEVLTVNSAPNIIVREPLISSMGITRHLSEIRNIYSKGYSVVETTKPDKGIITLIRKPVLYHVDNIPTGQSGYSYKQIKSDGSTVHYSNYYNENNNEKIHKTPLKKTFVQVLSEPIKTNYIKQGESNDFNSADAPVLIQSLPIGSNPYLSTVNVHVNEPFEQTHDLNSNTPFFYRYVQKGSDIFDNGPLTTNNNVFQEQDNQLYIKNNYGTSANLLKHPFLSHLRRNLPTLIESQFRAPPQVLLNTKPGADTYLQSNSDGSYTKFDEKNGVFINKVDGTGASEYSLPIDIALQVPNIRKSVAATPIFYKYASSNTASTNTPPIRYSYVQTNNDGSNVVFSDNDVQTTYKSENSSKSLLPLTVPNSDTYEIAQPNRQYTYRLVHGNNIVSSINDDTTSLTNTGNSHYSYIHSNNVKPFTSAVKSQNYDDSEGVHVSSLQLTLPKADLQNFNTGYFGSVPYRIVSENTGSTKDNLPTLDSANGGLFSYVQTNSGGSNVFYNKGGKQVEISPISISKPDLSVNSYLPKESNLKFNSRDEIDTQTNGQYSYKLVSGNNVSSFTTDDTSTLFDDSNTGNVKTVTEEGINKDGTTTLNGGYSYRLISGTQNIANNEETTASRASEKHISTNSDGSSNFVYKQIGNVHFSTNSQGDVEVLKLNKEKINGAPLETVTPADHISLQQNPIVVLPHEVSGSYIYKQSSGDGSEVSVHGDGENGVTVDVINADSHRGDVP